jgi:hypothetical protein
MRHITFCETCANRITGQCEEPRSCYLDEETELPRYYTPMIITCPHAINCAYAGKNPICYQEFDDDSQCRGYKPIIS